jgi:hypothetical protein
MEKPHWVPHWLWRTRDELVGAAIIATLAAGIEPFLAWRDNRPPSLWGVIVYFALAAFAVYLYARARPSRIILTAPAPRTETTLKIVSAYYGTGPANDMSVTEFLESQIGNALSIWVGNNLIPNRPDPASGKAKRLTVKYSFGNEETKSVVRDEYAHLVLPEDETTLVELTQLRKVVAPVVTPQRQLSESEFRMQQIADSEFRSLAWAQRVGLREIYRQPGQFVGVVSGNLSRLGFADPGTAILDKLQKTSLINVDGRHNLNPSPFPSISEHVERLLKELPL